MSTWTREQAEAWAAKQEWHFRDYYKYRFYFTATDADGVQGAASAGGQAEDIYRYPVHPLMNFSGIIAAGGWDLRIDGADGAQLYLGPEES